MIQLVFVFGVVLPTLITVACFIGFLICWFRFRSLKRHHVTDRKSSVAACPRRCRVYAESSSAADVGTCSYRTARCFWSPTGSTIPPGSRISDGWATRGRNSVVFPLTTDMVDIDTPSTAAAKVRCPEMSIKHPNSRSGSFRPTSGLRSSTTLPGFLLMDEDRRKVAVSGRLAQTGAMRCLSNTGILQPEVYISGSEMRKKSERPSSRAISVDACYVEVEPTIHAIDCPTTSHRCPRISISRSTGDVISKTTRPLTTTSGLSVHRSLGDSDRKSTTHEIPRLAHTRRHHSLAEVPHHGELQIKPADQTSLNF